MKRILGVLTVVVLGLSVACASLPIKQKLAVSLSASVDALGAFQQTERNLYAAKSIPQLTPKVHETISRAIADAADAQVKTATALLAWKASDSVPLTVTQAISDGQVAYDAVATVVPKLKAKSGQEKLLVNTLQAWLKQLVDLAHGFNLSTPAWAQ